jgi:hypothetical protein
MIARIAKHLIAITTKHVDLFFEKRETGYKNLINRLAEVKEDRRIEEEYYTLDSIDSKCTALLTHVSMMIAATVFLYADGVAQHTFAKDLLLLEISIYVFIALSLLYCLDLMALDDFEKDKDTMSVITRILVKRLFIYRWALLLTVVTTIAVLGTLALKRFLS